MFIPVMVEGAWSTRLNFTGQFVPKTGICTRHPTIWTLARARHCGRVDVKEGDAAFERDHCELFALEESHAEKRDLERIRVTKMCDGVIWYR